MKTKTIDKRSKGAMNKSIHEWYLKKYPTDDLGQEIPEKLTFCDIYEALEFKQSVYALLGDASDSIVRERIFEKLSKLMYCNYLEIYNRWLECEE